MNQNVIIRYVFLLSVVFQNNLIFYQLVTSILHKKRKWVIICEPNIKRNLGQSLSPTHKDLLVRNEQLIGISDSDFLISLKQFKK